MEKNAETYILHRVTVVTSDDGLTIIASAMVTNLELTGVSSRDGQTVKDFVSGSVPNRRTCYGWVLGGS
ncbi:hypothetical protein TSUD_120730 [Trifolium subterraneum]|uniref:Uncharacterized protein n=1 Tax=Trifolium subterraneum TaxID=3900 RepID=A0A2Z6LTP6_TRISU|nr:hypothetical protein TSUD_120730 [Trifolium subterraneum]